MHSSLCVGSECRRLGDILQLGGVARRSSGIKVPAVSTSGSRSMAFLSPLNPFVRSSCFAVLVHKRCLFHGVILLLPALTHPRRTFSWVSMASQERETENPSSRRYVGPATLALPRRSDVASSDPIAADVPIKASSASIAYRCVPDGEVDRQSASRAQPLSRR